MPVNEISARAISRRNMIKMLGVGAVAGAGLTACAPGGSSTTKSLGSASPSAARGEATLWFDDDDVLKVFKTIVPSFNQKYPNVKMNLVGVDVSTKLAPTLISGTGVPDGSYTGDGGALAQADQLYDLTSLMKPYTSDTVQYKLDVNTVNGKLVGIPWDTDPGLCFYREDILSASGVDPTQLTSYDALLDAARSVKAKYPNSKPIPLEQDPALGMQWLLMLVNQQQGSGLTDANGKLTIDTDAFRTALTWIKQIVDEGLGTRCKFASTSQIAEADNGTISIVPWAIWFNFLVQSALTKSAGHWRVQQLPAWTAGGARSGVMGGSSFIIPVKAAQPDLAWLFYEHALYSAEGIKQDFGPNTIYPDGLNTALPSVKSALEGASLFNDLPQLGNTSLWDVAAKSSLAIPPGYHIPTWFDQAGTNYLGPNLQLLMDGKMSVDDVISKSASDITTNLVDRS
ncbi:extracellular solute-binding protein [Actinospica durhamensis]|uniref:Extracellular solute-binding protein n=1 Tax=Actinospica durhamensis TaxID=1508375 RepID=A0A941F0A4_9ACTN|nr:extracellular solute-binding protein [Actinospica durhamensis]MBR7838959.1 extracellular solute-binding protein [Actinospica durhamensis]